MILKEQLLIRQIVDAPTRLNKVSEERLMCCIACDGVRRIFDTRSVRLPQEKAYKTAFDPVSEGYFQEAQGGIQDKNGMSYDLLFSRDADNRGVQIIEPGRRRTIVRLKLRDRRFDGMPEATSPGYLKSIGLLAERDIPDRSKYIGATNWYYSSPLYDTQESGRRSVEFSIVSSDPTKLVEEKLKRKAEKLYGNVSPDKLAEFTDDPFSMLPQDEPTEKRLSEWYTLWFQIVNRGLRGKRIPLPGQVSERGFDGFLRHVVQESTIVARENDFTHLSAVPTWGYVWNSFLHKGRLSADNRDQHRETMKFFTRMNEIIIPIFSENRKQLMRLGDISENHPARKSLQSWFAILPYALELNADITPQLPISQEYNEYFQEIFQIVRQQVMGQDGRILTYPLAPGKNLWQSKPVQ